MQSIARFNDKTSIDVTFTDDATTTGGFQYAMHAGALLLVRSTSTGGAVEITFLARPTSSSSEFFVAGDSSNAPVTLTVEPGRCYQVPDVLFAAPYVAAQAATGATVTVSVFMKG